MKLPSVAVAFAAVACGLAGCGGQKAGDEAPAAAPPPAERVVNVYNWSDYMSPELLEQFEAETGIKVNCDTFDSLEMLETKLLTGNTGYDVVVPSAPFLQRRVAVGVYQPIDRAPASLRQP